MVNTINTSIKQVPAIVTRYADDIKQYDTITNYGCGKYPELVEEFLGREIRNYDPNYSGDNERVDTLAFSMSECCICANVLNVIEGDEKLDDVVQGLFFAGTEVIYLSVYEGDRSGEGNHTTKGYQRNEKVQAYEELLLDRCSIYEYSLVRKGNQFIISKEE